MKRSIAVAVLGLLILSTAAIVINNDVGTDYKVKPDSKNVAGACRTSLQHLEASLRTTPADGKYYNLVRKSVRMPIRSVILRMRGRTNARQAARNTRAHAQMKLAAGVTGAEKRFYEDTILRANALIEVLDCLKKKQRT
jgi:hypothetical protein